MCTAPSATVYCADITVEIATAEPDPTSFGETARNIGETARSIGETARSIGQTAKKYRPDSEEISARQRRNIGPDREEISAQTAKKYRRGGETKRAAPSKHAGEAERGNSEPTTSDSERKPCWPRPSGACLPSS